MNHADCPRCGGWVNLAGVQKAAACPACAFTFGVVDIDVKTVEQGTTSEVTEMAIELSNEVDRLKAELARWQGAVVVLAEDLEPAQQVKAALMIAEVPQHVAERFLEAWRMLNDSSWRLRQNAAPP